LRLEGGRNSGCIIAFHPTMCTAYHAKYFAYELTKRCASDSMEKLAASLADAQVDLNPHQVEAALFAFRSPLSRGAILADEVGLGKTIEAGILLSQRWAERKRKILIIVPASLRKQWYQELSDKFFLPSVILETKTFNEQIRLGNLNPLTARRSSSVHTSLLVPKSRTSVRSHGILPSLTKRIDSAMSTSPQTRSETLSRVLLRRSTNCS
jgi:SNF2 family DNA or RNA helicase